MSDLAVFCVPLPAPYFSFFFFNATATTEIYTLSLHDALPIYDGRSDAQSYGQPRDSTHVICSAHDPPSYRAAAQGISSGDRKSTRLNSSHMSISYAVFCLKKKKNTNNTRIIQHMHKHQQHEYN